MTMRHRLHGTLGAVILAVAQWGCDTPSAAGTVAAATPEAAAAGARILAAGGNAIDAAVAVSFALAVTEPAMSGLGGQTQILMHHPDEEPIVINGTSFAPSGTHPDASDTEIAGHRATTIPTTVRALDYAWREHGSGNLDWAELLQPAIEYAADGFVVGHFRHQVWNRHAEDLLRSAAAAALFLTADRTVPPAGSRFRQPVLARTLRRLAEHGASDFYTGQIAQTIAADMAANDGWLSLNDLQRLPEPQELQPLHGTYRGLDVYTLPPPGGGWVVLQVLNLLEHWSQAELRGNARDRLFRLAEALRIGHRERRDRPVVNLVGYQAEVEQKTSKESARELYERTSRGETTHFTVADADGMVVSATASINNFFGARAAAPDLGFLYNDYMREFEIGDPEHPFALRPHAMPYSSMSPTIVVRNGRPILGLGSPGSARIISTTVQVIQLWVDTGLDIGAAVAAPRIHVVPDSLLYIESAELAQGTRDEIGARGFILGEPGSYLAVAGLNAYFGGVHAVAFEDGRWQGAADPRRDGAVLPTVTH